jgi:hypothetical protein
LINQQSLLLNYYFHLDVWIVVTLLISLAASATLDAFMLPNDDPRVLRGRARLAQRGKDNSGNRVDWARCENRHLLARSEEELGDQRPFTGWSDAGNTALPSFAWNDWMNAQVHRIHDLTDINTLRLAKDGGIDATYKTMVWNLSQNVDRDTMGKLGLCMCLTPSGVPYVTNRGGPLVGEEGERSINIPFAYFSTQMQWYSSVVCLTQISFVF